MTRYEDRSTAELTALYNEAFGKAIKVGSYPKAKMIDALRARDDAAGGDFPVAPTPTPEVDPMRPEEAWPTVPVVSEPVNPLTFEEAPGGVGYPAPAPKTPEELETPEARLARGACPFCGGDPANQTAAGVEGTFLGDACNECHDCGKTYHSISGEEVPASAKGSKKRRLVNPQGKINAKVDALKAEGFSIEYQRPLRAWEVTSDRENELGIFQITSREFAEYKPAELVALAASRLRA